MGLGRKKETENTNKATFKEDLGPNEEWLQSKVKSAKEGGLSEFGVPKRMGSITGTFSRPLELPTYLLGVLKGEQGEQNKVRKESLDYIRKNWDKVKKEPIYVEVDPFGRAWVNEGNHRIMVARELGEKTLPVEVRYFSGGQREAGPFNPTELIKLDEMSSNVKKDNISGKKRLAGKAGLMSAALGAAGGASASEIAESFLPMALTPSTLAPGTLTPEQKAEADAAYQRKLQEEEAAKAKAQALLRSGAIKSETKMAKGGMMNRSIPGFQDGGNAVEPTTGNDVPIGSLPNEVADDIPARLSEGEFVLPADVVRFIGLERLMKLRDEAKAGLRRMAEVGQMGNAEDVGEKADENYEEDTGKFESDIDEILSEVDGVEGQTEKAFAQGGVVGGAPWLTGFDLKKAPKNPVFDVRYYKHPDGRIMYVTFFNGKPMTPIPDGFTQTDSPVDTQIGKEEEKKTTPSTAPAAIDTTLGGGDGGESQEGTTGGSMSLEAAAQSIAIGNALSGYASGSKGLGPGAAIAGILGAVATNVGYSALSNYASRDVLSSMAVAQAEADAIDAADKGLPGTADQVGFGDFSQSEGGTKGGSTDVAGNIGLGGSEAGGAGDAGAAGGSGYGCVDPKTPISISLTETKKAEEIKIGDFVYTPHERTLEYGMYKIIDAKKIQQPKLLVTMDDNTQITLSTTHKFLLDDGSWKEMYQLDVGAKIKTINGTSKTIINIEEIGEGDVMMFTVEEAHTYVADGLISHNMKAKGGLVVKRKKPAKKIKGKGLAAR